MAAKTKPRPARAASKVTLAPVKKAPPATAKAPAKKASPATAKAPAATPRAPAATAKAPPPTSKAPLASSAELPRTPPATVEEYLLHIGALGKRVEGHVAFMGAVERLNGTSSEAKNKALTLFYQRLVAMEQELGRVREELELG
jgi:hypothetical protein